MLLVLEMDFGSVSVSLATCKIAVFDMHILLSTPLSVCGKQGRWLFISRSDFTLCRIR